MRLVGFTHAVLITALSLAAFGTSGHVSSGSLLQAAATTLNLLPAANSPSTRNPASQFYQPDDTDLSEGSSSLHLEGYRSGDFPDDPIQIAWFYKNPKDGQVSPLVEYYDEFILTKGDEGLRDQLKANGKNAPYLRYILLNEIQGNDCGSTPWRNHAADQTGDFCTISDQHPDWFLLDSDGNRIEDNNYYLMDPGNPEWRTFWIERARQYQASLGWDGIFMDNVEASLGKFDKRGIRPALYPDDASYQSAIQSFLQQIYTEFTQPEGQLLYGNIISLRDPSVWHSYMQYMDGALLEDFAVGWHNDYYDVARWEQQLDYLTDTQRAGKRVILVAQGEQGDNDRQQFAFASYLLLTEGRAAFRYTNACCYRVAWPYDNYQIDLGQPLGERYQEGGVWKRDFSNGLVWVDPGAHTSGISLNGADQEPSPTPEPPQATDGPPEQPEQEPPTPTAAPPVIWPPPTATPPPTLQPTLPPAPQPTATPAAPASNWGQWSRLAWFFRPDTANSLDLLAQSF
ncbi:MAG: hypothetical protein GYA17_19000, partial [Chloroflexi bacterium]|nr:hypothetical protein [Chloroflexota bacterium]